MLATAGLHVPPFRQLHNPTVGDNDAELLFESVTTYVKVKSVLLINHVTFPVVGFTISSVPFVSIAYVNASEVLLDACIWNVNIC